MPDVLNLHQLATEQDARGDAQPAHGDLPIQPAVGVFAPIGYLYASLPREREGGSGEGCVAVYAFDLWDAFARGGF